MGRGVCGLAKGGEEVGSDGEGLKRGKGGNLWNTIGFARRRSFAYHRLFVDSMKEWNCGVRGVGTGKHMWVTTGHLGEVIRKRAVSNHSILYRDYIVPIFTTSQ